MKILTVIILATVMQVSAGETLGQNVTLKFKKASVKQIFKSISRQTGVSIIYKESQVEALSNITLNVENVPLETALHACFLDKPFAFTISNKTLVIIDSPKFPAAKDEDTTTALLATISGRVTDDEGNPVFGATITIATENHSVVTTQDGSFSIQTKLTKGKLLITHVNYESQEYTFKSSSEVLKIVLKPKDNSLNEIVAIGYGTQKVSDVTGSIATVRGSDMEKTPANTFVQSLQGRSPGVDIKSASNAPGGGIRIRIRGANSINASSEPLYVIDGFPVMNTDFTPDGAGRQANPADPLSSLSPNEIESIEILKDASATAIYGSRGANGVVLVTTKRGKAGKARIDFDYSLRISSVRKKLELANAEELATLYNEWAANNGRAPLYDGINKPLPKDLGEGTDWQDVIFRTALTHDYNLSISGGSENTRYMIAGSYLNQDGIIIESNFKRYGLKFNLDQKVSNRIKIGANLAASHTINDAVPSDGTGYQDDSPLWNALATTPAIPVYDENGNYVNNQDAGIEKILENPVSIAKTRTDITYTTRLITNAFADVELLKDLTFKANFGTDIINAKRNIYIPNTAQTQALPNLGVASIGSVQTLNWLAEYTLTYNKELGADHRFTALGGYTAQATRSERVFSETQDFSINNFEFNNLGAGSNPRPSTSNAINAGLVSLIGRINYAFKDRYLLTATVRRDGSSKFGEDKKWGTFPSVGLAWRLSEENFLRSSKLFNNLKLRTSYGLTGNQAIGSYSSLSLYNNVGTIIGGSRVIGAYPNSIANPDLKWEKTDQFNLGFDAGLLDGKLTFSTDFYVKNTKDLLLNVTIPNQVGYSNSIQNIGEVQNKGVEFSLGYRQSFGEIKWNTSFNISFNRNKVVSLSEGTDQLLFGLGRGESAYGQAIVIPGQPLGSFFGYHFLGIWQTEEEITNAKNAVGGVNRPGLPRYDDLNGDGFKQNNNDKRIIGNPNPDFIYGFSNSFTFRNFNLYVFINGSYGNEIANLNRIGLLAQPQKHNVLKEYYDQRWRGPGTSNTIEAPLTTAGEWKNFSDRDVLDGSYLRVKTITLSYNLPPTLVKAGWLKNGQVYIAGENLITATKYSGFDPEVDLYASSNTQLGVDNGAYPMAKSIRIGVKLGF